jgi:hypothetical protein
MTIKTSGRTLKKYSAPVLRNAAGNRCGRAKKMDAEAINQAKHTKSKTLT